MKGMLSKHGTYPVAYDEFKAYSVWWRNEFNDFCVVVEATFIMTQYLATHSKSTMEFLLVSDDYNLRMQYNQSEELQYVLGQLNITQCIEIQSFDEL